jgi:hopanoid-associated phosphorylase
MTVKPLLVATGFTREARIAAQPGVLAIAGGGVPETLEALLEAQASRACAIASFGLTGALADGLRIGDWIIGDRLVGAVETETHAPWRNAVIRRLPLARVGAFYADGRMIASVEAKRALGRDRGALAVDMESHIAARVAARHGLPFLIVRIVSDGVDHMLPPAITVSMKPGGAIDTAAMLRSLLRQPRQVPEFTSSMIGAAKAFRGLARGHAAIGPRLAFPDLG